MGKEQGNLEGRCSWDQWSLLVPISLKGQGTCQNLETERLCGEGHVTETSKVVQKCSQGAGHHKERGGSINTQGSFSSLPLILPVLPLAKPTESQWVGWPGEIIRPPGHRTRQKKLKSGSEEGNRLIKFEYMSHSVIRIFSESAKKGRERYIIPKDEGWRWKKRKFGLKHDLKNHPL